MNFIGIGADREVPPRSGAVSEDVGGRLVEEVDVKLDRVHSGESTVRERGEGYEEFWRERTDEFGVDYDEVEGPT